jgi:eukaryotic-like serine/threonine-protein kinase
MAEPLTQPATQDAATTSAAPSASEPDLTGQTLGDFRILRRLGQGGMGQVYLADQISLKRHVALKFLKPELAANDISLKRFKQEAESVARVTHANIVQIYWIGETAGSHYMALEYVEGKNLREFLEKKGTSDVLLGLRIMIQVAAALQRASELGIVHRDIKPENILLTRTNEVKVADFGLSRCFAEQQATHLTQSNVAMGTPLYMSPEQVEGKRAIDHRSDIYSFGVTCYHMFAGQPPFRGTSPHLVAAQHVQAQPQSLAEIRPDLPADLCTIIHKMMAKLPEARYQTAREILRDVSRLYDAVVATGTMAVPAVLPTGASDSFATLSAPVAPALPRSPWRKAVLLGSIPLALALGIGLGYLQQRLSLEHNSEAQEPNPRQADDLVPVKAIFSAADEEKRLVKNWQESIKAGGGKLDEFAGQKHAIDLGLFYLKEKRWDDADKFFQELEKAERGPWCTYLGNLGKAMTLAFRDQADLSNKLFEKLLDTKQLTKFAGPANAFLRSSPALREMIANALRRNAVNAPDQFPPALEAYRHPPRPPGK